MDYGYKFISAAHENEKEKYQYALFNLFGILWYVLDELLITSVLIFDVIEK